MKYRIIKETLKNGTVNYYAQELVEISYMVGPNKSDETRWEAIYDEGKLTTSTIGCNPLFAAVKDVYEAKRLIAQRKLHKAAVEGHKVASTEIIEEIS